jgi:hypothetical protein
VTVSGKLRDSLVSAHVEPAPMPSGERPTRDGAGTGDSSASRPKLLLELLGDGNELELLCCRKRVLHRACVPR